MLKSLMKTLLNKVGAFGAIFFVAASVMSALPNLAHAKETEQKTSAKKESTKKENSKQTKLSKENKESKESKEKTSKEKANKEKTNSANSTKENATKESKNTKNSKEKDENKTRKLANKKDEETDGKKSNNKTENLAEKTTTKNGKNSKSNLKQDNKQDKSEQDKTDNSTNKNSKTSKTDKNNKSNDKEKTNDKNDKTDKKSSNKESSKENSKTNVKNSTKEPETKETNNKSLNKKSDKNAASEKSDKNDKSSKNSVKVDKDKNSENDKKNVKSNDKLSDTKTEKNNDKNAKNDKAAKNSKINEKNSEKTAEKNDKSKKSDEKTDKKSLAKADNSKNTEKESAKKSDAKNDKTEKADKTTLKTASAVESKSDKKASAKTESVKKNNSVAAQIIAQNRAKKEAAEAKAKKEAAEAKARAERAKANEPTSPALKMVAVSAGVTASNDLAQKRLATNKPIEARAAMPAEMANRAESTPRFFKSIDAKVIAEIGSQKMVTEGEDNPDEVAAAVDIAPVVSAQISRSQKVFFAGDSILQGISPFTQQWLRANGVESINKSKASTGLANPKFFDWPSTIEQTLNQHSDIGLLVMLVGANDVLSMQSSETGRYHSFQTAEWEAEYKRRIDRILAAANRHNVSVIWITPPFMGKSTFSSRMVYLNQFFRRVLSGRAKVLPLAEYMSGGRSYYVSTINENGQLLKLRARDGIHFTSAGARYASKYLQKAIIIR